MAIDVATGKEYEPPVPSSGVWEAGQEPALPAFSVDGILRLIAALNLLAGILVGLMGPFGPVVGIAFAIEGVIGCVMLVGFASLVENVAAIRRRVEAAAR